MAKDRRPRRARRSGLDGKQKAQIAVAVVSTLRVKGQKVCPESRIFTD